MLSEYYKKKFDARKRGYGEYGATFSDSPFIIQSLTKIDGSSPKKQKTIDPTSPSRLSQTDTINFIDTKPSSYNKTIEPLVATDNIIPSVTTTSRTFERNHKAIHSFHYSPSKTLTAFTDDPTPSFVITPVSRNETDDTTVQNQQEPLTPLSSTWQHNHRLASSTASQQNEPQPTSPHQISQTDVDETTASAAAYSPIIPSANQVSQTDIDKIPASTTVHSPIITSVNQVSQTEIEKSPASKTVHSPIITSVNQLSQTEIEKSPASKTIPSPTSTSSDQILPTDADETTVHSSVIPSPNQVSHTDIDETALHSPIIPSANQVSPTDIDKTPPSTTVSPDQVLPIDIDNTPSPIHQDLDDSLSPSSHPLHETDDLEKQGDTLETKPEEGSSAFEIDDDQCVDNDDHIDKSDKDIAGSTTNMTLQPLDENTEIHSSQSGGDELNDNHELQRMMTTVTDMNRIKDDKAGDMFNNDDYSEPILKYDHDKESIRDGNDNRDYYTDQPDKDLCQSTGNMTLQPLEANPEIHSSQAEREESNDNDQLQQMMTTDINTDMDKENNDEVDYGSNDDDNYSEEMQGSDEDKESLYDDKDDYDADASVMQRESMSEEDWNMLMTRRKQLQMELNDDIKQFFGQQELPETKDEIPMDQLWQTLKENLGTKLELLHLPEGQIVNEITAASNAINKATRDFIRENHDPDRQQLAEMFCAKMVKMLEEHIRNFEELRLLEIFSRRGYTELKNARAQYLDVKTDYDKLRKTYSKQVEMMTKQKQKKKLLQGYKTFFQDIQDVLAE